MMTENKYYGGERFELARFLPISTHKALEIGCAAGGFRANLGECEYWGVECVEQAADLAKKKLDKVLVGTFEEVYDQLPNDYFDTVICNDVIEHMVDHDQFFRKIKAKMVKNGKILGSIPNVRHVSHLVELIFYKDWKYREAGILDTTHLRFFTLKSMERTLGEHGFKIEILEGINSTLPKKWYRISRRSLWQRLLALIFGSDLHFRQICFLVSLDE